MRSREVLMVDLLGMVDSVLYFDSTSIPCLVSCEVWYVNLYLIVLELNCMKRGAVYSSVDIALVF